MKGYIDNVDFVNLEPMKYWSYPAAQVHKAKTEIYDYIMSGDYIGARKVDGYYQRLVKDEDGNCFMIARNRNVKGEVVNKLEWLPQIRMWCNSLPNGTVLLCECYLPNNEGSKNITSILGCLKDKAITRQKQTPLHLYVFDCIAVGGRSMMNMEYIERAKMVRKLADRYPSDYVEYAKYYEGLELWNKLQEYLATGYEGIVIMKKDAVVYQKRTPARVSIKVKKELQQTIDCVIIGTNPATREYGGKELPTWEYWQNTKTNELIKGQLYQDYVKGMPVEAVSQNFFNQWPGSFRLGLYKDGELMYIGDVAGLTNEMKTNAELYMGKVIEIGGMEVIEGTMGIRHPRILGFRDDKAPTDCLITQLIGE